MTGGQPLARVPPGLRWALLVLLSAALIAPIELIGLPASFMLGAMVAAIVLQVSGAGLSLPHAVRIPAEGLLGGQLAQAITPPTLLIFAHQAPLFLSVGLAIIAVSTGAGWILQRRRTLPGTTAIWGLSPGAANVMMLMSGEYGADERLVAFMQYVRVLIVATLAPVIAHTWGTARLDGDFGPATAAAFDWHRLALTLLVVAIGLALSRRITMASGTILLPFFVGGFVHAMGWVDISLPAPLMSAAYVLIGWSVGQNFTPAVLRHAWATLPQVLLAILALVLFCALLALLLARVTGIDGLSAYLATSPGGLSSVAIIAATSKVDLAFVIAMQTLRFVLVLLLGPPIARYMARRMDEGAG